MTRNSLHDAADEVDAIREEVPETELGNRLQALADQLRSQAERDATPALGTLDRIQYVLREIASETADATVRDRLENVREQILSFLATLDDRGMKQHGENQNTR